MFQNKKKKKDVVLAWVASLMCCVWCAIVCEDVCVSSGRLSGFKKHPLLCPFATCNVAPNPTLTPGQGVKV